MIMINRERTHFKVLLWIGALVFLSQCASTQTATIPQGWNYNINWENFESADVTPSDHLLVQSKEDMIMLNGTDGRVVNKDIRERGGFFSELGRSYTEQVKENLLVSQRVEVKYYFKELPQLNSLLLFNRVEEGDAVRSINLDSGEENWRFTSFVWNMDKYKDIANIAINQLLGGSLAAHGMSQAALQTRLIRSMIKEVPQKNAFLFRTVEKLYFIDHASGEILWESENFHATGIADAEYLPKSDQLLIAGSMKGLKDVLENADEDLSLRQLMLMDAESGEIAWQSNYTGRSEQVRNIVKKGDRVHLLFDGGSAEVFDFSNGNRRFGTRDGSLEGATKLASFSVDYNLVETPETAEPQFDQDAVYAVNPLKVKAVGVPDKQLQKMDYGTGEILWKTTIESTPDIRDMHLRGDNVIVRLSSERPGNKAGNVSNIVGKVHDLGIYAYSKEDGGLSWKISEPFKNHVTNVIYEGDYGWAGGGESLYKFNLKTGEVLADSSFADPGIGEMKYIYKTGNNIVLIGFKGMAVVDKSDLRTLYSTSMDGRLSSYEFNSRFLVMNMGGILSDKQNIHIFNTAAPSKITSFTLTPPEKELYGELGRRGFHPTRDFKQIITLTESGIKSYKIF